ncbi:hypothetical protein DVT68_17085 [Dyella solisilvae]|uniref:Uncharacterized protein n=1 Tax=Dyella solisilvae TaxID=1920168 RepID=A0A370K4U9_9GAMM|nr:hypothetical protein [Dyella solisilvae]RDI97457.1 hypothetical protein DVT68_17085 [Dyella solisilvae]
MRLLGDEVGVFLGKEQLRAGIAADASLRDVTVEELRIECWFPDDQATAALCRQLAREPVEA